MNKQMKSVLLVGMMIPLFSACGQLETVPVPIDKSEPIVTVTESPTDIPTAALVEGSAPEKSSNYIGLTYPPLPAGLSQRFDMLIQESDGYGLSLVLDGANKMLWLSKLSASDSSGESYWVVKDILDLSNVEAGLFLIPDGCFLNGKIANEIFVARRNGVIVLAWRANTTLDVFEVIPTSGIECNSDKAVSLE